MTPWLRRHWLFVAMVGVPTMVALVYYSLLASDVYISESRFLVRRPQKPAQTGIVSDLLLGSGLSHSQDDTYSVRDYILSRDALKELESTLGLRQSFASPRINVLDRFPGVWLDAHFEEFYRYYGKHVSVDYDTVSSISALRVRAYSADEAYRINAQLLTMGERLINALNDRSSQDLINFAQAEVERAADKAKQASLAMLAYRSSHAVFEPERQAVLQLEGVAKLQQELVSNKADLAQLKKISPDNPQIAALSTRGQTLRGAIAAEAAKVTGEKGSFSAHAPDYERLALDVEFADKQVSVAFAALESARSEAMQKQLYLERLVQPNVPDKAMEPRRIRSIATVALISLIAWGVATLLIASVREHAD